MSKFSQNAVSGFAVVVSLYIVFVYTCEIVPVATGGTVAPLCGGSTDVHKIANASSLGENQSEDGSQESGSEDTSGNEESVTVTAGDLNNPAERTVRSEVFVESDAIFPFDFDDNNTQEENGKITCLDDGHVLQWDENDNEWECRAPVYTVFDDIDKDTVKVLSDGAIECRESNELLRWNGESDEWECASLDDLEDRDPNRGPASIASGPGSEIYFTDSRNNTTSVDIKNHETLTELSYDGETTLRYTDEDGVVTNLDLAPLDTDTTYTAGTGLQLLGTEFSVAPNGITTDLIAEDTITADDIAPNAIGNSELGFFAVGSFNIRPFAVRAPHIAPNTINRFHIGPNQIRDRHIDYASVTLSDFTNDAGFITSETDDQDLTLTGDTLAIEDGNSVDLSKYLDTNTTYTAADGIELIGTAFGIDAATCAGTDKLQWTGTAFACMADVDTQLTEAQVDAFVADNGYITAESDDQNLTLTGDMLAIENGNNVDLRDLFCDADGDTCFHVEKNTGENLLRFDIAGTEQFVMDGPQLLVKNSGQSVFIGDGAGNNDDLSNNRNTLIGHQSGAGLTTESYNTFVGYLAGQNFALGTAGGNNTFIGRQAGQNAATVHAVGIGRDALRDASGTGSIAIGYRAGEDATGNYNTFLGYNAGRLNMMGQSNIFLGQGAGRDSLGGRYNLIFGYQAGLNFGDDADDNLLMGRHAGRDLVEGSGNISLGYQSNLFNSAGSNNVMIGRQAGRGTATYSTSGNVFIGNQAGYDETGSDRLHIDNRRTATPLIYGEFDNDILGFNANVGIGTGVSAPVEDLHVVGNVLTTGTITLSDERLKDDVEDVASALTDLLKVRGTTYNFADDAEIGLGVTGRKQYGVIAQNVEDVFPALVHQYDFDGDGDKDYKAVNYTGFTPVIIEAIRELRDDTQERLEALEDDDDVPPAFFRQSAATEEDVVRIEDALSQEIADLRALISTEGIGGIATSVTEAWEVYKDIVFKAQATFENAVAFLGRVTFMDRVTFGDSDIAGYAEIAEGDYSVHIVFDSAFTYEPVITVTPRVSGAAYAIEDESVDGFTITLDNNAQEDLRFSWIALSVAEPKTFSSQEEGDAKEEEAKEESSDEESEEDENFNEDKVIEEDQEDDVDETEEVEKPLKEEAEESEEVAPTAVEQQGEQVDTDSSEDDTEQNVPVTQAIEKEEAPHNQGEVLGESESENQEEKQITEESNEEVVESGNESEEGSKEENQSGEETPGEDVENEKESDQEQTEKATEEPQLGTIQKIFDDISVAQE